MAYDKDQLKRILGLRTDHEVRSRIEAIKDLLEKHDCIRHGDKNRLLLTDNGLALVSRVHELTKQGLTLRQAAQRLREEYAPEEYFGPELARIRQDLRLIRTELAQLKARLTELERRFELHVTPWWKRALPWGKKEEKG